MSGDRNSRTNMTENENRRKEMTQQENNKNKMQTVLNAVFAILFMAAFWLIVAGNGSQTQYKHAPIAKPQSDSSTRTMQIEKTIAATVYFSKERNEKFKNHLLEQTVPYSRRLLNNVMTDYRSNVNEFLDWHFSYNTKGKAIIQSVQDSTSQAWNWTNSWFGREPEWDTNRNVRMTADKFKELVICDYKLEQSIFHCNKVLHQDFLKQINGYIIKHNEDLSEILARDFNLTIDPALINKAFKENLEIISTGSINTHHAFLLSTISSAFIGSHAGTVTSTKLLAYASGKWYAGLSTSAKLMTWAGLKAPAAGSAIAGVASGVITAGAIILTTAIIDLAIEKYTRPKIHAEIVTSLNRLEQGILYGDYSTPGLEEMTRRTAIEIANELQQIYEKTIRQVLKSQPS